MNELPYKLRVKLAMEVHRDIYMNISFFHNKPESFIEWIGPLLQPFLVSEMQYIYSEGDEIKEIYFLVSGIAGFVLPRFSNAVYIEIECGDYFGSIDIFSKSKRKEPRRKFTVQALTKCELLILSIKDIDRMKVEFPEIFEELFTNSFRRLKKAIKQKKKAIEICEQNANHNNASMKASQLKSMVTFSSKHKKVLDKVKQEIRNSVRQQRRSSTEDVANYVANATSLKRIDENENEESSLSEAEELKEKNSPDPE